MSSPTAFAVPTVAQSRVQPPLISARTRPFVALLVAAAVGIVTWLGVLDYRNAWADSFDLRWTYRLTHHLAGERTVLRLISDLGGLVPTFLFAVAMITAMVLLKRPRAALLAALAPLIATSLTEYVLKPWVHRAPFGTDTYPSGHSTGVFAMATVLAVVLLGPTASRRLPALRWGVSALALLIACVVAVALVAVGYHFFTDTIGGAAVGIATVCLTAFAIDASSDLVIRRRSGSSTSDV